MMSQRAAVGCFVVLLLAHCRGGQSDFSGEEQSATGDAQTLPAVTPDANAIGTSPSVQSPNNASQASTPSAPVKPNKPSDTLVGVPASARDSKTSIRTDANFFNASFVMDANNPIISLHTTLWVPQKPPASGVLFAWPGLQDTVNGKGVLQPVMVWGPTCTSPGTNAPASYSTWWIAGFYVTDKCTVGKAMPVAVDDPIDIDMTAKGSTWTLTMRNWNTNDTVTFAQDLPDMPQNWAIFSVEPYNQLPVGPVYFANTTMRFAKPLTETCKLFDISAGDGITDVKLSDDKLSCSFDGLVLRNANTQQSKLNMPPQTAKIITR